tara:strand:+ start:108 stop:761 length:654 start_codon:yes stop_codon:yes gene_type:complete
MDYNEVHINTFVKRQTPESTFSHCARTWDKVQEEIADNIAADKFKDGHRDGIILVDLMPHNIMSGVTRLTSGMNLAGVYEARRDGETPRIHIYALGVMKNQAKSAYAVMYSSTLLSEDQSNELDPVEGNWELVSINSACDECDTGPPIEPTTLMHNHFGSDGGTETKLSDSEFVEQLRESFDWWKNRAFCDPEADALSMKDHPATTTHTGPDAEDED